MNWSALVAASSLGISLLFAWIALSQRATAAEIRTEMEKVRTELANQRTEFANLRADNAEKRSSEFETLRADMNGRFERLRSDINGSYMRANLVQTIIEGIHNEIRAIAGRITLMEHK